MKLRILQKKIKNAYLAVDSTLLKKHERLATQETIAETGNRCWQYGWTPNRQGFFHFELRADLETRGMSMDCFLGGGEAIVPIQSSMAAQRQNQLESRERGIQEIPY